MRIPYRWIYAGLALLLLGCGGNTPPPQAEPAFSCAPDTLHAGDTMTITLPDAAEGDLAIVDPQGTLFVAYRTGTAHPQLSPAPAQSALTSGDTLRFQADSLQIKPYAYDARAAIPVFRERGSYEIRLGPNLADGVAPQHRCTVFVASSRSTSPARP